jgi:putative alpha-1,2-mannosidase
MDSTYTHLDEKAEPGYYGVTLTDDNIRAEFTTTVRAGMHRYTRSVKTTTGE